MTLEAADLERVVRTVWSTQLGLALETADPSELAEVLRGDTAVLVKVYFVGEFNGRIEQRCSPLVSLSAAAAAFAASGKDVGTSDIRDTASEMAHMTAGNLKRLLPGASDVSNSEPRPLEQNPGSVIAEAGFRFEGEPLVVSLIRTD